MSEAPAGGGYSPLRCATSGRLTPAASTFTSTSPAPGLGMGRCPGLSISGPPGCGDLDDVHACGKLGHGGPFLRVAAVMACGRGLHP